MELQVDFKLEPDHEAPFPEYLGRYTGRAGPNRIDRKLGRLLGEGREHEFHGYSFAPAGKKPYTALDLDDGMPVWVEPGAAEAIRRLLQQAGSDYAVERRRFGRAAVKVWAYAILQDDLAVKCHDEARQMRYFVPEMFEESPDGIRIAVEDWERAEAYNDGAWQYLTPQARVTYAGVELAKRLGPPVESDSGPAAFSEVAGECLAAALDEAGRNIEHLAGDRSAVLAQIQAFDTITFLNGTAWR